MIELDSSLDYFNTDTGTNNVNLKTRQNRHLVRAALFKAKAFDDVQMDALPWNDIILTGTYKLDLFDVDGLKLQFLLIFRMIMQMLKFVKIE